MSGFINPADEYFKRDRQREDAIRSLGQHYGSMFEAIEGYREAWNEARVTGFRADELTTLGFLSPTKLPKPKSARVSTPHASQDTGGPVTGE